MKPIPRIFLDTNILIDFFVEKREFHPVAVSLLDRLAKTDGEMLVAGTSLKDIYYVISRLSTEKCARECINVILDTMRAITIDRQILEMAAKSDEPDFEDGIIRACAETEHANFLVTRDETGFESSWVKKLHPAEFSCE